MFASFCFYKSPSLALCARQETDTDHHREVEDEGYESCIESDKRISAAQDEECDRDGTDNEPGEDSRTAGPAPVKPQYNSGKELRHSCVAEQEERHNGSGARESED